MKLKTGNADLNSEPALFGFSLMPQHSVKDYSRNHLHFFPFKCLVFNKLPEYTFLILQKGNSYKLFYSQFGCSLKVF